VLPVQSRPKKKDLREMQNSEGRAEPTAMKRLKIEDTPDRIKWRRRILVTEPSSRRV